MPKKISFAGHNTVRLGVVRQVSELLEELGNGGTVAIPGEFSDQSSPTTTADEMSLIIRLFSREETILSYMRRHGVRVIH